MKRVLEFVMRSRVNAVAIAMFGLLFPLFNIVTNGIVGLVTLRHGLNSGVFILAAATAVTTVLTSLLFSGAGAVIIIAVSTGMPVLLLAAMLKNSRSLSLSVLAGAAVTAVSLVLIELVTGDSVAWWRSVLQQTLLVPNPDSDPATMESITMILDMIAPLATKLPIAIFLSTVMALLIARWWQALLDRPGAFSDEFCRIRLPYSAAGLALGVSLWALITAMPFSSLAPDLMYLAVVLFVLQGIAVAHAIINARGESKVWLVAMYVTLLLVPRVAFLLAIIGWSDVWLNYRARLRTSY